MGTLASLDMVVIVFATNHLDVKTTYLYGRSRSQEELKELLLDALIEEYGEEALEGFEILSVVY